LPKAFFESIEPAPDTSFAYKHFPVPSFPFHWHFHPEIELTLIIRGRGRRFVGDNIAPFGEMDLVLLGSNLPHTWRSDDEPRPKPAGCHSIVIQFRPDFLGSALSGPMKEMRAIAELLGRARLGFQFVGHVRDQTAEAMHAMEELAPLGRLTMLLEILDRLAHDDRARALSSPGFRPAVADWDQKRITRVCDLLNREFTRPIKLAEAADLVHLSASAFARFFQRATGKHFTAYLTELRVGRACELMIETEKKIATIAHESGFENLSHFNRTFQRSKGSTPREFRKAHAKPTGSVHLTA
jgi:AraC-like DNA-binding protein